MHRRTGTLASLLPCLLLGLAHSPAIAQDAAAAAPAKREIDAIAPADIPARADADERFAQDVIERAGQRDPSEKLAPRLDALASAVHELSRTLRSEDLHALPVARLESLARHWEFYGRRLVDWRRELERATGRYSEEAADLAARRANWVATRSSLQDGGVATALSRRIDTVTARLAVAEQAVSAPLDRQIRLSRRANAVEDGIDAGRRDVAAAIDYIDSRLGQVDAPPIWQLWGEPRGSQGALNKARAGAAIERDFMREYTATHDDRFLFHAIFAALLLPLLAWLSVRGRKAASEDPELQASAQVLVRPISSWLVLVLLATIVIEPDAPTVLHELALLLALVPVLRLLPREVFAVLGVLPYVATGLYLLARLGFVFLAHPLHYRLHLLAVTALTLVALVWLLLRARRRTTAAPLDAVTKAARFAGWLAVAGLLVSIGANLFGNASLAQMLTGGLLDSGYAGLVLYAGVTVLSSVLRLLFARRVISRLRMVEQHGERFLQGVGRLLRYAAVLVWAMVTLNEFRMLRPVWQGARAVVTYPVPLGQLSITLGSVLLFALSLYLAMWMARTVRVVLRDAVLPRMALPRGVGNSISSLTYYALVMIGLLVALAAAGFEVSQLTIVVGALGVGIGFGLQNVVNNFVSGLILMFERPIQPGDVVEITGTSGRVREIGMRATTLTTFEGADVIVPNGTLLSEKLINWTLSDMNRRVDVNVGVAYGADPRRVMDLLKEVTKEAPGIVAHPEPSVIFTGFGASSLDFGIRAWTDEFGEWVATRTELTVRVYDALKAAGIEIPFPQQDIHLRSVAPQVGAQLAGQRSPEEPQEPAPAPRIPG
ncbi:MAG: mechanosensitive ion channel domain-containing protein [Steroidobacteraceae bacterium]